jgi:hypothetical protein
MGHNLATFARSYLVHLYEVPVCYGFLHSTSQSQEFSLTRFSGGKTQERIEAKEKGGVAHCPLMSTFFACIHFY